eukprot:364838-Chlamydomonas_euryale.AAC.15
MAALPDWSNVLSAWCFWFVYPSSLAAQPSPAVCIGRGQPHMYAYTPPRLLQGTEEEPEPELELPGADPQQNKHGRGSAAARRHKCRKSRRRRRNSKVASARRREG